MVRKAPSFTGLKPASAQSARAKRSNTCVDTQHERLLRRELWRMGLRFRKNVKTLPGKPDIVFPGARVAIFCDGDFWHGRKWQNLKRKLNRGSNASYWLAKIASNIERDTRNTVLLERTGWRVIRFWETDIKKDPSSAANLIKGIVESHRNDKPRSSEY